MPFLGNEPSANFQTPPAVVRFSGDGSDTTFDLGRTIGSVQEILVSVDGVVQDSAAYTVTAGSTLTYFGGAFASLAFARRSRLSAFCSSVKGFLNLRLAIFL